MDGNVSDVFRLFCDEVPADIAAAICCVNHEVLKLRCPGAGLEWKGKDSAHPNHIATKAQRNHYSLGFTSVKISASSHTGDTLTHIHTPQPQKYNRGVKTSSHDNVRRTNCRYGIDFNRFFFHHPSAGAYRGSDCMKTTLSDNCLIVHLASTPQNAHAT